MFLNSIFKIFNSIFPKDNIKEDSIRNIINKRIFVSKKNNYISFLPYQNKNIKHLLYQFKFNKKFKLANFFGEIIYENLPEILEDLRIQKNFNDPLLIPIPISFLRKLSRGYDQNNLILKSFIKNGGNNFITVGNNILIKSKHTKPQSKMGNKKDRFKNVKNCFKVKNVGKIKGKNIILFDDILTTGATLLEAKRILKKSGAKKIIFLTLTH